MQILNTEGLFCPEPVMLTQQKLRAMSIGQKLTLVASDPATLRDIPKLCHFLGHILHSQKTEHNTYYFVIEKAG